MRCTVNIILTVIVLFSAVNLFGKSFSNSADWERESEKRMWQDLVCEGSISRTNSITGSIFYSNLTSLMSYIEANITQNSGKYDLSFNMFCGAIAAKLNYQFNNKSFRANYDFILFNFWIVTYSSSEPQPPFVLYVLQYPALSLLSSGNNIIKRVSTGFFGVGLIRMGLILAAIILFLNLYKLLFYIFRKIPNFLIIQKKYLHLSLKILVLRYRLISVHFPFFDFWFHTSPQQTIYKLTYTSVKLHLGDGALI